MLRALLLLAAMPAITMSAHEVREYVRKYWDVSTESSFTHDDYDGFQIPADDDVKRDTTKEYSFLKRRALSIEKAEKGVSPMPPFTVELLDTVPASWNNAHHKNGADLPAVSKRKNDKKQYSRKFKYDPALMLMGLGKRKQDSHHEHNKTLTQKRSVHESEITYVISDKEQGWNPATKDTTKNNYYSIEWKPITKRSTSDQPLMMMMDDRKSVVTFKKPNLTDNGMQSILDRGSTQIKDYLNSDITLAEEDMSKNEEKSKRFLNNKPEILDLEDEPLDNPHNADSDFDPGKSSDENSKRSPTYDPALKYMGLGKKDSFYDPALKYMGLGKKSSSYDPALRYMGLGKKSSSYDPALRYMGLGKKSSSYDPALRYMGLGKRNSYYDPALKYMGLGKKSPSYDPALRYMGLGKKDSYYDPALKYMGLGKRSSLYDPALRYMGLGKKDSYYDPALKYMGLGKRSSTYDPALRYMGLGKRNSYYDPALKYMGLGKKSSSYDPALRYMGLGKKSSSYDPALRYMGLGKKSSGYDPALKYMGLGKKNSYYDPALKYMGLGKKSFNYDPAIKYMGLGKRNYDPALKYMGLGKKSPNYDPALKYMGLGKKSFSYDPALKYMGLGKKSKSYDPALKYMGLGKKRFNDDHNKRGDNNQDSRKVSYDPALIYMGLGKRQLWSESSDNFSFQSPLNYKDTEKQVYDTNTQKRNSLSPTLMTSETTDYIFNAMENATNSNQFDIPPKSADANNWNIDYNNEAISDDKRSYGYDTASSFKIENKAKESESPPVRKSHYNYPDPKFVQKLVNYFDSLKPQNSRYTPKIKDEESESFENSYHQNVRPNNHNQFLRNSQKKSALLDPALRYMGLGKRNATGKPEFEIPLSDKIDPDCENTCKYSNRKKRDVNHHKGRLSRINSPHFRLKIEPQDQLTSAPGFDDLVISSDGDIMTLHESKRKRERDNRPKYNPGWIFIGLGKRAPDAILENPKTMQMDQPNSLLLKYYNLMEKMKDNLQKVKYDLIDKGYRNNDKWIAFHNVFTGESGFKGYPEFYNINDPPIQQDLNDSPDSDLYIPPLNSQPYWKVNIVSAYENPPNTGK
ncbi:uncharacterized protein LOC129958691 [Argiope bruennichi]|uniref:uncharacterized protein LOC129958691 n=1 Tax=Argiope bruennichi TaxID=94029 RepID=UPI002494CB88|nr:uncharacterized protein LOC129958691 [Argiope bruennichi]